MEIDIVVEQLAEDWVVIHPVLSEFRKGVELGRLPGLIGKSLVTWLREHPGLKVRETLGLVEEGSTIAVHVWLDPR